MEQADAGECHCDIVLVAGLDDIVVTDRTAGLCNVSNNGLLCTLDVVTEREECVRSKTHIGILCKPCLLLLDGKYRRLYLEDALPLTLAEYVLILIADVNVDRIVTVSAADVVYEPAETDAATSYLPSGQPDECSEFSTAVRLQCRLPGRP